MSTLGAVFSSNIIHATDHPYYVKVAGGLYHSLPPLLPEDHVKPRFSQIYVLDTERNYSYMQDKLLIHHKFKWILVLFLGYNSV